MYDHSDEFELSSSGRLTNAGEPEYALAVSTSLCSPI